MSERGSILPLIAGLLAPAVAVLVAVSTLSTLTLERHLLMALAELAALRSSESFDPAALRREGPWVRVPLTSAAVASATKEFLASTPHEIDSLRVIRADSPDGERARVILEARWRAPLLSDWVPTELPVRAEAWARSVIR